MCSMHILAAPSLSTFHPTRGPPMISHPGRKDRCAVGVRRFRRVLAAIAQISFIPGVASHVFWIKPVKRLHPEMGSRSRSSPVLKLREPERKTGRGGGGDIWG